MSEAFISRGVDCKTVLRARGGIVACSTFFGGDMPDDVAVRPNTFAAPTSAPMVQRTVQDSINFNEGPVYVIYPPNLSERSLTDMNDWLALIARKIQRSVKEKGG
jgi:hypothetical protein